MKVFFIYKIAHTQIIRYIYLQTQRKITCLMSRYFMLPYTTQDSVKMMSSALFHPLLFAIGY